MLELHIKVLTLSPTLFAHTLVRIHFFDVHLSYEVSNHILVLLEPQEYLFLATPKQHSLRGSGKSEDIWV